MASAHALRWFHVTALTGFFHVVVLLPRGQWTAAVSFASSVLTFADMRSYREPQEGGLGSSLGMLLKFVLVPRF
jgi:hypothetical protein